MIDAARDMLEERAWRTQAVLAGLLLGLFAGACGKKANGDKAKPIASALTQVEETEPEPAPPPEPEPSPCDDVYDPKDPFELVDDFEDGDGILPIVGDRNGSWYVATDGTRGASIQPAVGVANPDRIVPPRCASNFAMHLVGRGFNTWGAVLGLNLKYDKAPLPVDLSGYAGIRFWLRAGQNNVGVLRVTVDDAATHPGGKSCVESGEGRPCWNSYGVDMPNIGREWERRFVHFDKLTQKVPEQDPAPLDRSSIYLISFKTSPGNAFDVWIDDVRLMK